MSGPSSRYLCLPLTELQLATLVEAVELAREQYGDAIYRNPDLSPHQRGDRVIALEQAIEKLRNPTPVGYNRYHRLHTLSTAGGES